MTINSHVDLCTFIRYIYIDHYGLEEKLLSQIRKVEDPEAFEELWHTEHMRNYVTLFHETYHYLQGVRLPFLYRYAHQAMRAMTQSFRLASAKGGYFENWEFEIRDLYFLTIDFDCYLLEDQSIALGISNTGMSPPKDGIKATYKLSIHELLECAASLAEWNVYAADNYKIVGSSHNYKYFQRWTKRKPAFLNPFNMIENFLEDGELALRCALPILCAAFNTTWPIRAFCELLATLKRAISEKQQQILGFLAQQEPCKWVELMDYFLDELIQFEAPPNNDLKVMTKFFRLNIEHFTNNSHFKGFHPTLSSAVQRWEKLEREFPAMNGFMSQPIRVNEETTQKIVEQFRPPLSVVRVEIQNEETRVFVWGDIASSVNITENVGQYALNILTMSSIFKRATKTFYHPDHRLCWHTKCPHFGPNYCNSYPKIPLAYSDCGFPKQAQLLIELGKESWLLNYEE